MNEIEYFLEERVMKGFVPLSKYILRYTLIYYVLFALVMFYNDTMGYQYVEQEIINHQEIMIHAVLVSVMFIVILLLPIIITMNKFIKNNNRVPNKSEKIKIIAMSYILVQFAHVPYLYFYRGYVGEIFQFQFQSYFELPIWIVIATISVQLFSYILPLLGMYFLCGWSSRFLIKRKLLK